MQKIDTQVCLLSESFVNIPDPRLESFSCLWNHCCLFCSCSFPQLLSHLSGIMASLTALIAVVSAGAWHLSSSIIITAIRADLSTKQRLSCGLLYEAHLRQQTVPATPYGSGRRLQAAKLSHILSKPLISGLIFAKIHDRNRSLLTWQLVLTNSIAFFHVEPPAAYTLIPHSTKWEVKV